MNFKNKLNETIFGYHTRSGKNFDIGLLIIISFSVLLVVVETVDSIKRDYGPWFWILEWMLTGIFTVEYILRVYCHPNRKKYVFSFYGIIDLVALLPTYLSFFFVGAQSLLVIRGFRLLRIFRVLKLARFDREGNILKAALFAAKYKITVFLGAVIIVVVIVGSLLYLVEGPENGYTSIPLGIYWAVVTITTVGYGDIHPHTPLGKAIATVVMILGYAIIAVPTGIVSAQISQAQKDIEKLEKESHRRDTLGPGQGNEDRDSDGTCIKCHASHSDPEYLFCPYCGHKK